MLVLSRKRSEQILIGDDIRVTVVKIGKHRVRLGIEAPKDKAVNRREIAIQKRSSPDRAAEIKRALKVGVPLYRIERRLDDEDNQGATS
jgi:carbon storage regulator